MASSFHFLEISFILEAAERLWLCAVTGGVGGWSLFFESKNKTRQTDETLSIFFSFHVHVHFYVKYVFFKALV